jgi:hypothetical protein
MAQTQQFISLTTLYSTVYHVHTICISPGSYARQPLTVAAVLPLYACHYLLAVFTILPPTYFLRLAFLPVVLWQAWCCAVGLEFSAGFANSLGRDRADRFNQWNYGYVVRDSFSKHILLPHAFFLGWDDRPCIEINRMGTRQKTSEKI